MSTQRLLFADSKNRDYPSGNSYVLHLTRPIKNIERVDLVSARVPNTMWNCTQGSSHRMCSKFSQKPFRAIKTACMEFDIPNSSPWHLQQSRIFRPSSKPNRRPSTLSPHVSPRSREP